MDNNTTMYVPFVVINKEHKIVSLNEDFKKFITLGHRKVIGERIEEVLISVLDTKSISILTNGIDNGSQFVNITISESDTENKSNDNNGEKYQIRIDENSNNTFNIVFNHIKDIKSSFHLLENVVVGIVVADDSMRILYVNRMIEDIFGYKYDELIGKKVTVLMPKEIATDHHKYVDNYKKTGETKIIYKDKRTVIGKSKDGTLVELNLAINEHWDNTGRYFLAAFERLERKFDKSYLIFDDIAKYNSTFMGNMSHEIRTPMNGIFGILDMLKGTNLSELQKYYVDICYESSEKLLKVLDDMLLFTKSEQGGIDLIIGEFDLVEMIEDMLSIMHMTISDNKKLSIVHYIHSNVPVYVKGDEKILRRVLQHIVGNAIKFTNTGEIELEVEKINSDTIKFTITDPGIGMTENEVRKLFSPYSQAQTGPNKKYGGAGLGLSICKLLVQLAKGEIYASSKYGKGSTFVFTMNLPKGISDESIIHNKYMNGKFKDKKVCIIDDNITCCLSLASILESFGIKSKTFTSVQDGLNYIKICKLKNETNDLLLLDYHMPEMNGIDAARYLMRNRLDIDIIMLNSITSYETASFRGLLKTCPNIKQYMNKPIIRKQLYNILVKYFNGEYNSYLEPSNSIILDACGRDKTTRSILEEKVSNISENKYCLVVDDIKMNRNIMRLILEKFGYIVHDAENGLNAIELIEKRHDYFVVFMDIHMPILNGLDAAKILMDRGYEIPIIAITADTSPDLQDKMKKIGFYDRVYKPIDVSKVLGSLENMHKNKSDNRKSPGRTKIHPNLKFKSCDINVIVVDDNDVNMIIMTKYMMVIEKKLGIKITVAKFSNGKTLVDYYRKLDEKSDKVDLILMDIEMPIMNGYQASKIIKELDSIVPIVGVSGHDELKFPELFDGQMVKPISLESLTDTIVKYSTLDKKAIDVNKYLNMTFINGFKKMGKDIVLPIIDQWEKDMTEKLKTINSLIEADDLTNISLLAHSIKGSSYQIGCVKLGDLLKKVEIGTSNGDSTVLDSICDIELCFDTSIALIKHAYLYE